MTAPILPFFRRLAALCTLGLATTLAAAQAYPSKPIRVVVPFPAGSATDTIARAFAGAMAPALGQPLVVDNKAGADGAIAGVEVARAAADGYTLLFGTNSPLAAAPALKKVPPYDPLADFTPIVDIGRYTFFLVVHPSVTANTLGELIAQARANPNQFNYATGNTTGIVSVAQFLSLAGIRMTHVPYKGEPQALTDLLAGRVQMMVVSAGTSVPHIRDGKLKALAVTLPSRSPILPQAPTMAEAGLPQFSLISWAAVVGPRGMPADIVDRLNREFMAAMGKPEVTAAMERQAFQLIGSTPARLGAFMKDQLDSYRSTLKAAGIEPE
ncbi:MAG: Bug family tripartite tricarboxylate transporter substrate binding protein [Aquabacterium sp.]